jgi:hypothetical protein
MHITLTKVKINAALSDETTCFSAEVLIDGVAAGSASNRGSGGENEYWPHELATRLHAYAATLPPTPSEIGPLAQDADAVIAEALDHWQAAKELKRKLKDRVLWAGADGIYQTKQNPSADRLAQSIAAVAAREKVTTLNQLPFDEAVALYRAKTTAH